MHTPANPGKNGVSSQWLIALRALVLVGLLPHSVARGQCDARWMAGMGSPGVGDGQVDALVSWDPDGPGPRQPVVVVGGSFTTAGGQPAFNIASYDPATGRWQDLGASPNGVVAALAVLPNGDLVAGGNFDALGGVPTYGLARFDGQAWSRIGRGFFGPVAALAVMSNGDLVAGGRLTVIDGNVRAFGLARWDGTAWSPLGSGILSADGPGVLALAAMPDGDLIAGGLFSAAGGVPANSIARWNGTSWSALGSGMIGRVLALALLPDGRLMAGGDFNAAGGVTSAGPIAAWDGTSWSGVSPQPNQSVFALSVLSNGDIIAGGQFTIRQGASLLWNVARWDGAQWHGLGEAAAPSGPGTDNAAYALLVSDLDNLVLGGRFLHAGAAGANRVALFGSPCHCPADLDNGAGFGSTSSAKDGGVTVDDLLFFVAAYSASDSRADLDDGSGGGHADGAVTIEDLTYFLDHFQGGC